MTKICEQTNVAEVDNSAVACEKFISTDCIIHEEAISYLGLPENSSTTDVLTAYLSSLIDSRNRVTALESTGSAKSNGFFDYNDLATVTTPIAIVGGAGYTYLTNDIAGPSTNIAYPPEGVTAVWDPILNEFDFSELTLGSKVEIRLDIKVTTTTPNTSFDAALEVGIGGGSYEITWINTTQKTAMTNHLVVSSFIYIGDTNTKDNPAKFKIQSDENISVQVIGWASYINLH